MGDSAAFLSAGGYHHHIGLNTWESRGGSPPPPGTTGLYHFAIRYPDRAALGEALRRLDTPASRSTARAITASAKRSICAIRTGTASSSYWDRPRDEWPRASDGSLQMVTERLDLERSARRAGRAAGGSRRRRADERRRAHGC